MEKDKLLKNSQLSPGKIPRFNFLPINDKNHAPAIFFNVSLERIARMKHACVNCEEINEGLNCYIKCEKLEEYLKFLETKSKLGIENVTQISFPAYN
ncbi:MAG: hypothetical protein WA666_02120 [Nitrospirota bacterium]